jgi:hypothetical protein
VREIPQLECGTHRTQGVVLAHERNAEDDHHFVADELVECASVTRDDRPCLLEKAGREKTQRFRIDGIACFELAEEHRHRLSFLAPPRLVRRSAGECGRLRLRLRCCNELERRVLPQDRLFELLECLLRIEPKLVHQPRSSLLVHREGVGLTPSAVEHDHQQRRRPLTERLVPDECLELADDLGMAPERQIDLEALLERHEPQLLEAADLVAGRRLVLKIRERRPPRERQPLLQ